MASLMVEALGLEAGQVTRLVVEKVYGLQAPNQGLDTRQPGRKVHQMMDAWTARRTSDCRKRAGRRGMPNIVDFPETFSFRENKGYAERS
jgi:hypothetical protein